MLYWLRQQFCFHKYYPTGKMTREWYELSDMHKGYQPCAIYELHICSKCGKRKNLKD